VTARTALVAGASGLVGGECLRLLLASRAYANVIVVTRRPLGQLASSSSKMREVIVDFASLERVRAQLRADHVFCALGTTIRKAGSREKFREVDFGLPRRLAELTLEAGATHFSLVSSLGANAASRFFYSRVKGELEDAVRAMPWPSLALLRPSVIAGDRQESRPVERITEHALRFALRAWRPVAARDIAAAMIVHALEGKPGVAVVESAAIPAAAARLRTA